jgi:hypothetical protein
MLENKQPNHDLGRSLPPTPCPALQAAARLCLQNTFDQLLVIEQSIGRAHPRFPEIIYFLSQNTGPQGRLVVTSTDQRNKRRTEYFSRYLADHCLKTLIRTHQFCAGK